jgi:hypothetical protein
MFVGMVDVIDEEPDDNAPVTFDHDETYEFIGVTIEETDKIYENYEFVPADNATVAFDQDETYEFIGVTIEVTDNQQNKIEDDDKTSENYEFCGLSEDAETWLADTGATSHITMCDKFMNNVQNVNVKVVVGDGKEITCTKRGDIFVYNDITKETLALKQVLYTPLFHKNIVSIGKFVQDGQYEVDMRTNKMILRKKSHSNVLNFERGEHSVLYYFQGKRGLAENIMSTDTIKKVPRMTSVRKLLNIDIMEAHEKMVMSVRRLYVRH